MKFTPGMLAGTLSGSQGNTVASHNRYGAYFRERTKPIIATSSYAQDAKNLFGQASAGYALLTDAQRLSWKNWALQNPIVDRLGVKRNLDGHAAFCRLYIQQTLMGGTITGDPPAAPQPVDLHVYVPTYDIGAGTFQIAYTATPLAANTHLVVQAAVTNSVARTFVQNLYKQVFISAAAAASPASVQTPIENRFGSLVVGQTVFYSLQLGDDTTGLYSSPQQFSGVVVST